MNTSNDTEMYDYDYNSTCNGDPSAQSAFEATLFPVLYYTLSLLGMIGNATILWVLLRYIKLKTMTDICLLNLVLSDLILAASLPLWAYTSQNLVFCKLMTAVYQLGFYSGTLFVTLMSVDRYLAIVHAISAMRARTLHSGIIASVIIWALSAAAAAPQVKFASLEIDPEDNSSQCQPLYPDETYLFWKKLRNFTENTVGLFVCLPIMIFCYMKILFVLSKSRNSKKSRAMKLIFAIVCVFVVCWVPYNVTVFLQTLQVFDFLSTCQALKSMDSAMHYAEIIAMSHCCLNPIIYAFVGEKFKKPLTNMLAPCLCCYKNRIGFSRTETTDLKDTSNRLHYFPSKSPIFDDTSNSGLVYHPENVNL